TLQLHAKFNFKCYNKFIKGGKIMDIEIKNEQGKFKFRVCGIVKKDDKFLIQKIEGNDFYCLAGGHVELGEDTLTALKREMKEEVDVTTKNEKLVAVIENFFKDNSNKIFHELGFYYVVETQENLPLTDYSVEENDKGIMKHLEFKWVTKEELSSTDFRPVAIKNILLKDSTTPQHIIYKN
ncbi:MAG: NUDIX domain-containing protein, partial [Clostridia bacterium]|nr:NUDIX domain-containing protein [Clostridia bacterium]